jgi:hypothetical protein
VVAVVVSVLVSILVSVLILVLLSIPVSVTVMVAILVPALVPIPMVIVVKSASISVPVPCIELATVVVRLHPSGTLVGWLRPVTFMPPVMPSYRVPVAVYPGELRAWALWHNANHAGTWRRANSDSKGDLSARSRRASQEDRGKQQCHPDEIRYDVCFPLKTLMNQIAQVAPPSELHPKAILGPLRQRVCLIVNTFLFLRVLGS